MLTRHSKRERNIMSQGCSSGGGGDIEDVEEDNDVDAEYVERDDLPMLACMCS